MEQVPITPFILVTPLFPSSTFVTDGPITMYGQLVFASLLAAAAAQGVGTEQSETHPKMTWKRCSGAGSCETVNGEVVIDSNWRWVHVEGGYDNCYDGNEWTSNCSGESDCTSNCVLEGADYSKTYGVKASGDSLSLQFVTKHDYGTNIGMSPFTCLVLTTPYSNSYPY